MNNITKEENTQDVLEYMRRISIIPKYEPMKTTLVEWCDYWLQTRANNIKNSTRSSYESIIRNHIKRVFKDMKLEDVTQEDVQLFINSLIIGYQLSEPLKPKTIKNIHGVLHKSLNIETKHKTEAAPLLYNTTQLLIAVSKKLDWDAAKTTKVLQQLYEKKYVSYPRTKAEHLTEAMKSEVKQTIEKLFKLKEYEAFAVEPMAEFTNRHFDDAKVASHTALIATKSVPDSLDVLDSDEKQLYDIIARSLIKIAYPKAEYDDTTVKISVKEHIFKASGKVITNSGWYAIDGKADSKSLPPLSEGQELKGTYKLTEGETEPPKRYTEAELLAAMELAGQKLEDEEARTLMKLQGMGLGTDATREPTLNELYRKEYIARKGKSIIPTELGTYIIDTLPVNELKSAEYTGALEKELNDIALGKADYNEYISRIKAKTSEWFKIIANSETKTFTSTKDEQLKCPLCGKPVRTLDWGYSCSGYKGGCKFSINKKIANKTITESQAIALCQKGKTTLIKGFKSKSGNTFDAYLIYNKAENKISFQFPDKKPVSKKK